MEAAQAGYAAAQLAAITLVATFALQALDRVIRHWKVPDSRRQQLELQQEIAHLQRQAAALNHPDTFAQSAKAERKAIALDKELSRLRQQQVGCPGLAVGGWLGSRPGGLCHYVAATGALQARTTNACNRSENVPPSAFDELCRRRQARSAYCACPSCCASCCCSGWCISPVRGQTFWSGLSVLARPLPVDSMTAGSAWHSPSIGPLKVLTALLFRVPLAASVPVVGHIPARAAWPLNRWLRVGAGKAGVPGAVGLLAWGMLCQRVSAAILGRS
ncbi:hypothetical protein ABPG75_009956 [Micractinium tetrahymenae]